MGRLQAVFTALVATLTVLPLASGCSLILGEDSEPGSVGACSNNLISDTAQWVPRNDAVILENEPARVRVCRAEERETGFVADISFTVPDNPEGELRNFRIAMLASTDSDEPVSLRLLLGPNGVHLERQ